jgi:hypothetical protein
VLCCTLLCCAAGVEGEVIIQKVLGKPFTVGYNAMSDKVTDLIEEGVIDPAKVTRNGLMNACSIAGIMLTTQVRGGGHPGEGGGVKIHAILEGCQGVKGGSVCGVSGSTQLLLVVQQTKQMAEHDWAHSQGSLGVLCSGSSDVSG